MPKESSQATAKTRQPRGKPGPYNREHKTGPKPRNAPKTSAQGNRKRYTILTNSDWLTVFKWMDEHPEESQERVVEHFGSKKAGALIFTQSTLSRRWKKRGNIEEQVARYPGGASAKRERIVTSPDVERALLLWVKHMESKNETVTGRMLVQKRQKFEEELNVPEESRLEGSGWVAGFCQAWGIKEIRRHGEAASVDLEAVETEVERISAIVSTYHPRDVFNLDETGLFAFAPPDRGLATKQMSGKKKEKFRITISFAVNSDGSEKLFPVYIGKYKNPRCFKNPPAKFKKLYYRNNKKAWMTAVLFEEIIKKIDLDMKSQRRHILLLIDNFSGHTIDYQPQNIRIEPFEPNMTSYVQPLDAGIIRTFKAHYRTKLCDRALELDGAGEEHIFKLNLLEAMLLADEAWKNISQDTIRHCWEHTRIVPRTETEPTSIDNSPARSDAAAWAVIREFATTDMSLPQAEQRLKGSLGSRFNEADWSAALKAVMDAEGDISQALEAIEKLADNAGRPRLTIKLPPRPQQTVEAEENLTDAVDQLRLRNRIFGVPLTLEELLDHPEERARAVVSDYAFEGVKDLDTAILDQVARENDIRSGAIIEVDSEESDGSDMGDDEMGTTMIDAIALCSRMEKLALNFGGEDFDGTLSLTSALRQFRGFLGKQHQKNAIQSNITNYFTFRPKVSK